MITRRDLVAATIAACITLACVSVAQQPGGPLDSTAWQWQDLQQPQALAVRRQRFGHPANARTFTRQRNHGEKRPRFDQVLRHPKTMIRTRR